MKPYPLLLIAWRNLWSHRLRTFLTIGGMTLGISLIVFLVSLGFGLERLVTNQVADFQAFTLIDVPSANLKTGKINQQAIERIQKVGHVEKVDQVVDVAGRVRLKESQATTETVVVGSDPDYFQLSGIVLETGHLPQAPGQAVINSSLATILGFNTPKDSVGKELVTDLILPKDLRAPDEVDGPLVKPDISYTIVGTIKDSANPIVYVPLAGVTSSGAINRTSLKVKVDERASVDGVRKAIENSGFSTEYVGDTIDQISSVFGIFRLILAALGLIALTVAGLGMFNTLTISLMERLREVALLKALGIKRKDIFKLFIAESLTVGVIGGILGILISTLVGLLINGVLSYLASRSGADAVSIYYSPWNFVIGVAVLSVIIGFVTGFYPAMRAIKTDALEVLRYE